MKHSIKRSLLAVSISAACASVYADGRIEGRVSDSTQKNYIGNALVELSRTNKETVTSRDGRFSFTDIAPGTYQLTISYIGAKPLSQTVEVIDGETTRVNYLLDAADAIETILVTGQAAGAASALSKQRTSDEIIAVVDADAIGQLSDSNVTEALQRLSGISIERDQGEGRFVRIRGAAPNLNTVSINGLNVPSPEAGARAVALDVIPAELVQTLEVSKSATPDKDANALGGNIEVQSLSGFDREGTTYSLSADLAYEDLTDNTNPKASATYTSVLNAQETFAIAAAISYEDRDFASHNVETDGNWTMPDEDDFPGAPAFNMPPELEQRIYEINRKRLGLAANFDYRPSDDTSLYLRTLHSRFEDQEYRQKIEWKIEDASSIDDLTATSGTVSDGLEVERELKNRLEKQTITSIKAGADFTKPWGEYDLSIGYSSAEEKEPGRYDAVFEGDLDDSTFASWSGITKPVITGGADAYNTDLFELDKVEWVNGNAKDEAVQFAANLSYNTKFNGFPSTIKVGGKIQARDKDYDVDFEVWEDFAGGPVLTPYVSGMSDYSLGNAGPYISAGLMNPYLHGLQSGDYDIDDMDSIEGSYAPQYSASEDSWALYAMQTTDFCNTRLIYGARYQSFATDLMGYQVERNDDDDLIDVTEQNFSNDDDFFLPSVHLRRRLNDAWQVRAALTTSAVRPTFEQMSPGQLIVREDFNGTDFDTNEAEFGNPYLETTTSTNFDATIEYYSPNKLSGFSAGAFYKDISDFVYQADIAGTGNYVNFDEAITFNNGDSAKLYGLEASIVQRFSNGFLVTANATFTDSEASYEQRADTALPGQSDTTANLVLGWEGDVFSARLATTYKSDYIRELDMTEPSNDFYQDAHTSVDMSLRAALGAWELRLDATNLTDEPYFAYSGNNKYNAQYELYGRTIRLGATLRNF